MSQIRQGTGGLKKAPPPTSVKDERSDLLTQIQKGKQLKKVNPEDKIKQPKAQNAPMNAAELLAQFMDQRVCRIINCHLNIDFIHFAF